MTTIHLKRRVQIVCAVFLHIPLVAIAAYAVAGEFSQSIDMLLVCLVATVVATVLIVPYIGRVLDQAPLHAAE